MKTETKDDIMSGLTLIMILLIIVVPISFWVCGFLTEIIKVETTLTIVYYFTGITGSLLFLFPFIQRRIGTIATTILFIFIMAGLVAGGIHWLPEELKTLSL